MTYQALVVTLTHISGPEIETEDQTMGIAQPTYVLSINLMFTSTLTISRRDQRLYVEGIS